MTGAVLGNNSMVGEGGGFVRGTISGNGSTAASGSPRIDLAPPLTPASGNLPPPAPGARSAFYLCLHDSQTGLYDFLFQDDFVDFVPMPTASSRIRWTPGFVLIPTTTSGSGVVLVATNLNQPSVQVVMASVGGANAVASAVLTAGILTITFGSTTTSATLAAYMNSHATTTTVTNFKAYVVGLGTDFVVARAASANLVVSPSVNGVGLTSGQAFLPSTTAGSGIEFTAILPGATGTQVQFLTGSGEAIVIANNTIEVTLNAGTSTNTSIIALIQGSTAARALVVPQLVGTGSDVAVVGGVFLSGGICQASLVGPVDPQACLHNGLNRPVPALQTLTPANLTYFHFKVQYTEGGIAVDQLGYGNLYIPSSTAGSGLVITSGASAPSAAKATVYSNSGTPDGTTFTALRLGTPGNNLAVVLNGPNASYFLPSTTSGSGVQFTAAGVGPLYTAVSIFETAPNGGLAAASPNISVSGAGAITITPGVTSGAASTNAQIVTAIGASAAASALVSAASIGTASDQAPPTGNQIAVLLSGGNSNANGIVTVQAVPNGNWSAQNGPGSTIVVQFGATATNANLVTAINASAAAAALVSVSAGAYGSDTLITTPLTFLAGGSSPVDTTVQVAGPVTTLTTAAFTLPTSSTIATVTVASTVGALNPGAVTGAFSFVGTDGVVYHATCTGSTATTFTTCTPTAYPGTAQTIPVGTTIYSDIPYASITASNLLIQLGNLNTNNTLTKVSAVINQANSTATPLVLSAPLGTASSVMTAGFVQAQTQLILSDLIQFLAVTKDQSYSLP